MAGISVWKDHVVVIGVGYDDHLNLGPRGFKASANAAVMSELVTEYWSLLPTSRTILGEFGTGSVL